MQGVVPQIWKCAMADGVQLEHEIERRHLERADVIHAEHLRHMLDRRAGQPALLFLRAPHQRDHRAGLTPLGVFADLTLGPFLVRRGEFEAFGLLVVKTA